MARNPKHRKRKDQQRRTATVDSPPPATPTGLWFLDTNLIAIFLAFKVVVIATMVLSFYTFDHLHQANLWNRHYSGREILDAWYLPFSNWDAQLYLSIADRGYNGIQNWAFYPLFPLCIRLMNLVIGNIYLAALVLNFVLSYLCVHLFYACARYYLPKPAALKSVLLFLSFPSAFFMSVIYNEALFLCTLFGFLYCYQIEKSYKSVIFAALMPLIRGQAFFIGVAISLSMLWRWYRAKKGGEPFRYRYELANLLGLAAGGAAYFLFFYYETGSFLSGLEAQKTFIFGNSLSNLINPFHFLGYIFSASEGLFSVNNGVLDKIFILAMLFSGVIVARAKNRLAALMYVALVYCPAAMGSGGSFLRFSILAFPLLAIALPRVYPKWHAGVYVLCGLFLCGQLYFAWRFSLNMWIG